MLSFSNIGKVVAIWKPIKKTGRSKFVYYSEEMHVQKDSLSTEELLELLQLQHGRKRVDEPYKRKNAELSISKLEAPHGGYFLPLMPPSDESARTISYVFGKSGVGKSFISKQLAEIYGRFLDVYIVSPVPDKEWVGKRVSIDELVTTENDTDENQRAYEQAKIKLKYKKKDNELASDDLMQIELALNDMKPQRTTAKLNTWAFTDKYKAMIKKPTLFVYDDSEAFPKQLQGKLQYLQDSQLLTGRHDSISMIIINHLSNSGGRTRNTINEAHTYTFFKPYDRYINYFLKEYLQMTYKPLQRIKKMLQHSRSVTVYKNESIILSNTEIVTYTL